MTKPQTFEEWLIGYFKDIEALDLVIASRMQDSYAAGMENAARICEQQRIGIDAFGSIDFHVGLTQEICAEAIREAAKR